MRRGSAGLLVRAGSPIALVACCAVFAAGCGGDSGHSSITLYNGQHAELTSLLAAAFEKKTGVKVRIRTNDSAVIANQIIQEGDASPADVYIAENSPELMELQRRKLLAQLPQSILGQGSAGDNSPMGNWAGMALRVSSLVYAPSRVPRSQLPASLLDLAQPAWKGKVAIAPTDSDFPPLVGAVIAKHGEAATLDWLTGLKRNARIYQDEEAVVAAVNRGEVATGVINSYYWYRLQLELGDKGIQSALYYFAPNDVGAVVNISGAARLESSKERKNAERFISFLLSNAGQQIIADSDDFEYPVRKDVPPNEALPPLASIGHTSLSAASLGNGALAARLIRQAGLV
jgi:iron(III) transport system substrate-binding protein